MKTTLFILGIFFAAVPFLTAEEGASGPVIIVPETSTAPVIDGDDRDPCWKEALTLTPLMKFNSSGQVEPASHPDSEVKLIIGEEGLYIFAHFLEPEINMITLKERFPGDKSASSQLWLEDHWELFIQPLGSEDTIQLMGDPKVRGTELRGKRESTITGTLAGQIHKDGWTMELMIPQTSLNVDFNDSPAFRFNFYRVRRVNAIEMSCWAPVQARFSDSARFGWLASASLVKTMPWLCDRFLKTEQQEQLAEIETIFTHFSITGQHRQVLDGIVEEAALLQQTFSTLSTERWKTIAEGSAALPDRLRKLWETAKLLEIVR